MQVEAQIREWTRRLLMERGHERNSVEGFLQSGEFRGALHMLSGWVFDCEAEFREDCGGKLLDLFTQWDNRRGRCMDDSLTERLERRREAQYHASRHSTVRIPIDWLPESQQREAERFLQYLQSKTRESVDAYLNALARAVGGSEGDGVEYLLELLQSSPCVDYYQGEGSLYLTSIEQIDAWQERYYELDDWTIRCLRKGGVKIIPDLRVEKLMEKQYHIPAFDPYGNTEEDFEDKNLFGRKGYSGLIYDGSSSLSDVIVILPAKADYTCRQCEGCFVIHHLLNLLNSLADSLKVFSYREVCQFALQATSLPSYVGYAAIRHGFINTYGVFDSPFALNPVEFYKPTLHNDALTQRLRMLFEKDYPTTFTLPTTSLTLLPFIGSESVATILRQVAPPVKAREWAVRLHADTEIRRVAMLPVITPGVYTLIDWHARLPAGSIERLLADWNTHAPDGWKFTSRSAQVDFRRALRNARRAIDGAKE